MSPFTWELTGEAARMAFLGASASPSWFPFQNNVFKSLEAFFSPPASGYDIMSVFSPNPWKSVFF